MFSEIPSMLSSARLSFLRQVLPLARNDEDYQFAQALAQAIGDISVDEAIDGFKRALSEKLAPQADKE